MKKIVVKRETPWDSTRIVSYNNLTHNDVWGNILYLLSHEYEVILCGRDFEDNHDIMLQIQIDRLFNIELVDCPVIGIPNSEPCYDISTLKQYDGIICYDEDMASSCDVVSVPHIVTPLVSIDRYKKMYNPTADVRNFFVTNSSAELQQINDVARIFYNLPIKLRTYTWKETADKRGWDRLGVLKILGAEVSTKIAFKNYFDIVTSSFGVFNTRRGDLGMNRASTYAAFAKRISVGYPETYQCILYPSLTSYDWRYLREQILRLIDDKSYYNECAEFAYEKVHDLDMENFKEPILEFVAEVINNG